jgi:MOSC domain-containing protein YiiM
MQLLSVNVGEPRLTEWKGQSFETGIFKQPVSGRVRLRSLNLDGDRQADLTVHGGANKAVYCYPSEHYAYWREQLPGTELGWGAFGENFTTEGILERDLAVGTQFRVGSAVVLVRTPRLPCYKLAARFRRDDMIERFLHSGRSGFYLSVVEEGEVGAGDAIELLPQADEGQRLSIAQVNRLYFDKEPELELLRAAAAHPALPEGWRGHFQAKLARGAVGD